MPDLRFARTVWWIFFCSAVFWELVSLYQTWREDTGKKTEENGVHDTALKEDKQRDTKKEK